MSDDSKRFSRNRAIDLKLGTDTCLGSAQIAIDYGIKCGVTECKKVKNEKFQHRHSKEMKVINLTIGTDTQVQQEEFAMGI